jgi:hypothetical protein
LSVLCCLFSFRTTGQEISQGERDSIFISALRDELTRSMAGLEDAEAGKPFFISYSLLNGVMTSSDAVLGSLTESVSVDVGDWYLRLMMGNYERNDENFVDPLANPDRPNRIQIACPVEPDYWGIRKAFWWNTDNVFRSAVKNYKNKLRALKEFPLDAETEKIPDYTKADAVRISLPGSIVEFSKEQTGKLAKDLSAVFRNAEGIYMSEASVTAMSSTVYMVNTEGSEVRIPLNLCMVNIRAQVKTEEEEILSDNVTFIAPFLFSLPPADTMKQAAIRLGEYLLQLKNAAKSREEYNGPVLLLNQASSNAFLSALFSGENSLIASREPLVYNMKTSMVPREKIPFETKIDKRIISRFLTVTALPRLEQFDGIDLMGSLRVDAEGIIPPEEILLVQDGILKNLLCNRVPTPKVAQSNGHHRIGFRMGGFTFQDAPSVIKISTAAAYDHAGLKEQLISLGSEKGLEFVYIIKPLIMSANYSPLCFYLLDISSGEEKMVRPLQLNNISVNDLNKRVYASSNFCINNILFGLFSQAGGSFLSGIPVSMIVPDALLLEEINLQPSAGGMNPGFPTLE